MMSLFSSFDFLTFALAVMLAQLFLLCFCTSIWKGSSGKEYLVLTSVFWTSSSPTIFLTLITSFLVWNYTSVFGYLFPLSSQLSVVFMVSLSLWLASLMHSLINNFQSFLSHLIPNGCPMGLSFLLFLIELVSQLIRPLTLTVRLVANILAGHVLLILLSSMALTSFFPFMGYTLLNSVEMGVAIIQSYIFITMIGLYSEEV